MSVFIAAADETEAGNRQGAFTFGGYVASEEVWSEVFEPAWRDRVLDRVPAIPYLHMAEIRSQKWRAKVGLTGYQADNRVEEAVRVISATGALYCVTTQVDGSHLRDVFDGMSVIQRGEQPGTYSLEPDYLGFLGFAYGAVEYIAREHPQATRVDFLIERKTGVTHHMADFRHGLEVALRAKGYGHLVRLVGPLIPGTKEQVPLQAADVVLWHLRRHDAGQCSRDDFRRLGMMLDGRLRSVSGATQDEVAGIAARSRARKVPSPFTPKPKRSGGC